VEQLVERVLGREMLQPETKKLVAALSMKIGGYGESIEITHYFIRHHLPRESMGAGRGWLVQVLRALSQQQGYPAETVMRGGHGTLGQLLGVNAGTVRRWMAETRAGQGGEAGLESFVQYQGVTKYADGSVDLIVRVARDEPVLPEHETIATDELEDLSEESDAPEWAPEEPAARPVRNVVLPSAQSGRIRTAPDAQAVMNGAATNARGVRIEPQPAAQSVRNEKATQARSLSALKGVGGSPDSDTSSMESNTSFVGDTIGHLAQAGRDEEGRDEEGRGWDLENLLRRASVHPTTRARLRGASPVAWVSWLLYWASPLGERLVEPTGNAVNRLKEAPMAPMAGAFERLAALGRDGLAELTVPRVLSRYGHHPSSQDWEDVMNGAPADRLRRLVDLLGFNLTEWQDDDADGELEETEAITRR
jgi:hypothetical protein